MSFELSSLGKEFEKNLEGGGKNQKYGIIYTPAGFLYLDFFLIFKSVSLRLPLLPDCSFCNSEIDRHGLGQMWFCSSCLFCPGYREENKTRITPTTTTSPSYSSVPVIKKS